MRLVITGERIEWPEGFRDLVSRRLYFALGRFGQHIQTVTVRFADANGPKGGLDKLCRIVVKLKGLGEVRKEVLAEDIEFALASAAESVGRSVARALERRRDEKRRPGVSMAGEREPGPGGDFRPPPASDVSDEY
jgi:ribosome-associated translation inhibitor RaiA